MTTLTEIANDPLVKERFPLLAAGRADSSPRRRSATRARIGGNVSQDARCWYYRAGWPCYRAGGNICYADTPTVDQPRARDLRRRSLRRGEPVGHGAGADRARRADGDQATATASASCRREDFFIGPGIDITRLTSLQPGDLLTAIRIPATWAGKGHYFEKVRDRQVWDFALVNIAASMNVSGSTIGDARMVVNGVAARRIRLNAVEAVHQGQGARQGDGRSWRRRWPSQGAVPLQHNAYKIPLMKALVKRAIRGDG